LPACPGYALLDLRLDWRNVGGSRLSLAAAVTNATNRNYRVSSASAFEIIGAAYSITGEPRMAFVEARYTV
jgi:outer membrane receptor protein involved in Fe transport